MATGNILAHFSPLAYEPPASTYAKIDTIVAIAGVRPVLKYATADVAIWAFTVPDSYDGSSGLTLTIEGAMDSANTGTKVVDMRGAFERSTGTSTIDATGGGLDFGGTEQASSITVNNTANGRFSGTITFTNAQAAAIQPRDVVRLKLRRVSTNDTATGNFLLTAANLKQS